METTTTKKGQAPTAQVDEMEGKLLKLESELREKEATLQRQIRELDARLTDTLNKNDVLRSRLAEALGNAREKDEELKNLTTNFTKAKEKIMCLEQQIDQQHEENSTTVENLQRELDKKTMSDSHMFAHSSHGEDPESDLHSTVHSLSARWDHLRDRNTAIQNQNDMLTNELTTFQSQVQVMKQELDLYHRLLDNAVKNSTGLHSKPGLNLTGQKVLELLEEIRTLREQLEGSIRTNQAMRERLRTSLEQTASGSASYQHSPATASRGTQVSERASHLHLSRVASEWDGGERGGRLSPATSLHSSHAGTGSHHAHSSPRSFRHQATGTSFSHPRETSTPHGGHHHEKSESSHKKGHLGTHHHTYHRVHSDGHHSTTHVTSLVIRRATWALTTTLTTGYTQMDTTPRPTSRPTGVGTGAGLYSAAGAGLYSAAGAGLYSAAGAGLHSRPDLHRLPTLLTQTHDLDSMETKGSFLSFLEELLVYLHQQNRQLDETKRLLTNFEQHTASVVTTGTGESGTVGPVLITPSHGNVSEQHTASVVGMGESGTDGLVSIAHSHGTASVSTLDARSRVSASRTDLSATYEHLLKMLEEAKKSS